MVTNLLRPWIVARLLTGGAVVVLVLVACAVAIRVLRHYQVAALSEGQLALERRAELVATVVQASVLMSIAGLLLTIVGADRSSDSIRGAMCAYGVFGSTRHGFLALLTSAASAAACGLWVVLHRLDLRLWKPALTRRKFVALLFLAPIVTLDLLVTLSFALELDLTVVASCCSSTLDGAAGAATFGAGAGPGAAAFTVLVVAGSLAAAAGARARRAAGAATAWTAAIATLVATAAAIPAVLFYVAPHAYETPQHTCPFCLLHADVGGLGWPLFAALFAAAILGTGMGLVQAQRRASGEPEQVAAMQRRLGTLTALSWAAVVLLAALPVVRFALRTGGASLMGPS